MTLTRDGLQMFVFFPSRFRVILLRGNKRTAFVISLLRHRHRLWFSGRGGGGPILSSTTFSPASFPPPSEHRVKFMRPINNS